MWGWGIAFMLIFAFMLSFLPCLYTFWHAIPTSFYFFISCSHLHWAMISLSRSLDVFRRHLILINARKYWVDLSVMHI